METLKQIERRAAKRHGGPRALEVRLQKPKSRAALRCIPDHRILAQMTRSLFQAGFVWRVIEAKWEGFEDTFNGFEPAPIARYSEQKLAKLAKDERIVRNPQKIKATRENVRLLVELAGEHGSAARVLADWVPDDFAGLWDLLKRRGSRLGGMTGPMVLRHLGVDTPMPTAHVILALQEQGVIEAKSLNSKRALADTQRAFAQWRDESGRSLTEISQILARSVGEIREDFGPGP